MEPTQRTDWKTLPFPERYDSGVLDRSLSAAQYEQLQRGLLPAAMEDKWFVFYEKGWLHWHRSWTGFGIYQVKVEAEADGGYRLTEVRVNRDPEQYESQDTELDLRLLEGMIDGLLRRQD